MVKAYAETGFTILIVQSLFGRWFDWGNEYFQVVRDGLANNETITAEYLNKTVSTDALNAIGKVTNMTSNLSNHPQLIKIQEYVEGVPAWLLIIIMLFLTINVCFDLVIAGLQNAFLIMTYPIIYALTALLILLFRLNIIYIYVIPQLWLPLAATVDSFLRIYILRALFFRFFRNHPLISTYAS